MMRGQGTIRLALAFATLLASLTFVIWRQSRALELLRELDGARSARAVAESERAGLTGRVQVLEGRSRIRKVGESRLGLRVPTAEDLVTLRRRSATPRSPDRRWDIAAAGDR